MSLKQLLQEKRENILNIAAKHGAFNVRVFGSVARGEETESSDIDFFCLCLPQSKPRLT